MKIRYAGSTHVGMKRSHNEDNFFLLAEAMIEACILLIGTCELAHNPEIPYRVIINEAIELAKAFGGTDGHKYVNGVLDKSAADLRPLEVQAMRAARA